MTPLHRMILLSIVCLSCGSLAAAAATAADQSLPRSSPESTGVSSAALLQFIQAADEQVNQMHSVMVLRSGQVIAEAWWTPEAADKPHVLWSLSKSFASTAVGLAVAEGRLSLNDPVLKFFPEEAPAEPSENLKAMTVRDLLTMSTGQETQPSLRAAGATLAELRQDVPLVKAFLDHPVPREPGTHFVYNSAATYMLSAIVQKVTGETLVEYLKPRLFDPLGIKDPEWETSPQGISLGGWGLHLRTEDIAKFGQLYLQQGEWNGKQLVPAGWIELATSKQVANDNQPNAQARPDWTQGYGFQFWRCTHGAYRGDGKDGQFCIVLPEQNAVVVMTAKTGNMQAQLSLVWEKLLPAFGKQALPENAEAQGQLRQALKELRVREPLPEVTSVRHSAEFEVLEA